MFAASFFPVFLIRVLIRGVPRPDGRVILEPTTTPSTRLYAIDATATKHRRARRIASSWPVPDGFAYKKSEEGHLSKEIDLANEFARQTRGGRRRRRLGPHKEARENAEREARQRSDADERCANGAAFQFIEPQRPWSLVPWAFQEHDPSVAKCGVAFRNQTRDFATHFLPRPAFPFCRSGRAHGADGRAHSTPSP